MTPLSDLVTSQVGCTLKEAYHILVTHKKKRIPIILKLEFMNIIMTMKNIQRMIWCIKIIWALDDR